MMTIICLDFETAFSSKDYSLNRMGPIAYVRDPRFHVLCMGVRIDRHPVEVFEHEQIPHILRILQLHTQKKCVVGHNLNGFDALVLSEIYGVRPYMMLDTLPMMRWCGLNKIIAESHAALTSWFRHGTKRAGTAISDGKFRSEDFTQAEWEDFKQYCREDVQQCSENFFRLAEYCTPDALRMISATVKMATEPAFILDTALLEQYITELDQRTEQAWRDLARIFNIDSKEHMLKAVRSPKIFPQMLRMLGVEPPMKYSARKTATLLNQRAAAGEVFDANRDAVYTPALSKTDLEFLELQQHPDERVALLVQTRLEQNSSIQKSRAQTLLSLSRDNKPLPILYNTFKAHTSRFTAGNDGVTDGIQMQNLAKRDRNQLTLRRAIQAPPGYKVVSCDSSQVEARMLAYIACEDWLLDVFRSGGDPYSEMAERVYNIPWSEIRDGAKAGDKKLSNCRHIGKVLVLSAGYGVSALRLSDTLLRQGAAMHTDLDKHHELAKHAHTTYRMSVPRITALWKRCQDIINHLYVGGMGPFGGERDDLFVYGQFRMPGTDAVFPAVCVPSGYSLWYPNLRVEESDTGKLEFFYDRRRGKNTVKTRIYGPMLVENITQCISFQLLQWQACRMYEEGIVLKGNNHDAWYTVVPEAAAQHTKERMIFWMSNVPPWLSGFPAACEAAIGDDFTIC